MNDETVGLIDASHLYLTQTGVKNYIYFGLFVAFVVSMVAGVLYLTATAATPERVEEIMGVKE